MAPVDEGEASQEATIEEDEIGRLKGEHTRLDEEISKLEGLRFPSGEEVARIKRLKKEKLSLKERITKIAT